jgi:gamma-glutamylcyclotransferase (GGCT)/AIG2-like uncharacterized protein YtfP
MPHHLFVYGTLHPDRAPAEIASAVRHLRLVGPATIQGKLYDLGPYPAVVPSPNPNDKVPGTIFALPGDPAILTALDHYEDYRPADPARSLFVRTQCTAALNDGSHLDCWVYRYNRELPGA